MTRVTSPLDHWRRRSLELRAGRFSGRRLDAGGVVRSDDVRHALSLHGAVHVVNTGLETVEQLVELMPALGFDEATRFELGGRTSAATQQKWVAPGLRRLDFYPPDLHLLANNEVQYRRSSPRWVLFACLEAPVEGGRALLHSAEAVERELRRTAPDLLERMLRHGFSIETGFLDDAHPEKANNTFQSWQERFGTNDADEALRRAQAMTDEYDACWWGEARTLMTRITLTAKWPDARGVGQLRFPRVALDGPSARNGFRRFPLGNGEVLTAEEESRVREALLSTAEGLTMRRGDLVLFDNLRFGHSRESFNGERVVLVGMAGEVWDPAVSESVQSRLARQPDSTQWLARPEDALGRRDSTQAGLARPEGALESIVTAQRDSTQARLSRPEEALGQPNSTPFHLARPDDTLESIVTAQRDSTQARLSRPEEALGQRDSTPLQLARRNALEPLATDGSYSIPPRLVRRDQRFSTRVFDAGGALDDATVALIEREFTRHGALHVRNTGITTNEAGGLPESTLRALRFGGADAFPWGGMSSGRTTRKALSRELRATDEYPAHLWLLPHNEVLYQRTLPARLLFFSAKQLPDDVGGRTFVHSSKLFEQTLRDLGGAALLDDLRRHGLLIEMGFVDDGHPERHLNFFRSWQERFDTTDREEAARRCRASTHQFDECWWRDEGGGHATLMTRIRVPAFCDGHLLFPRIALDEPSVRNGHRRYPRGDGVPFTKLEVDLLLHAFLETREGTAWGAGDVLLVDNVRYGHSREAYSGPRSLGVAMAGVVDVGPPP